MMKAIIIVFCLIVLAGCGTVGGTLSGAGTDLGRVGEWIKSK